MSTLPAWLVLIVRLPSHPSSLRVKAWRRLHAVGAVALKNSVYLLPATAENQEHLQRLAQEVQKDGGDATLLRVGAAARPPPGGARPPGTPAPRRSRSRAPAPARGPDLAIRGLLATFKDDHEVLAQGMILFDGLYAIVASR